MARSATRRHIPPVLRRFAECLQEQIGATRVLLFGSHARGSARLDSDYDIIVVSPHFVGTHRLDRALGLRDLFYAVGGHAPMDLICLTPEEFEEARQKITLVAAVLPETIDLLPTQGRRSPCQKKDAPQIVVGV